MPHKLEECPEALQNDPMKIIERYVTSTNWEKAKVLPNMLWRAIGVLNNNNFGQTDISYKEIEEALARCRSKRKKSTTPATPYGSTSY